MSDSSPRLGLPYIQPSQAQKHVTHNTALQVLDIIAQLTVLAFDAEDPPADPEAGACYALGAAPTGAWAGRAGELAIWDGSTWMFLAPGQGWRAWGESEARLRVWQDGGWSAAAASPEEVDRLGVATAADDTNRLSVAAEAVLFSHDGGDHRVKVNKASAADTASLLFQSGWTGHAEIGLTGGTAFAVKISADGTIWAEAMRADPATQSVTWGPGGAPLMALDPDALQVDVPVTGTAVQTGAADTTPRRLMTVGAFGLGATDSDQVRHDDGEASLPSGFYSGGGAAADAATFPTGASSYAPFINATRRVSGGVYEQARMFFGDDTLHLRHCDGAGVWSDPVPLYSAGNLLGPVSQSGGIPTGAVIERGSNADGEFVRFADGTQICTRTASVEALTCTTVSGSLFNNSPLSFAFPAAFSGDPWYSAAEFIGSNNASLRNRVVSAQSSRGGSSGWAGWGAVRLFVTASTTCAAGEYTTVKLFAIGRWF